MPDASRRSVRVGLLAAAGMAAVYAAVVGGLPGSLAHLGEQVRADWILLGPIIIGFGAQVGLVVELRRRRQALGTAAAAGATGTTGSTVGMVACCAHHLADLAPLAAATGAATILSAYRTWFMAAGLAMTAVGVAVALLMLRADPAPSATEPATRPAVQTADAGGVVVSATLERLDAQGALIGLALDTHSGALDADLVTAAGLTVGDTPWPAVAWDGDPPGGHHRAGTLHFDATGPPTGSVRLDLEGLPAPVTLTWSGEEAP